MLGCGGRKGRCGKRYKRRCRKVCWGMGEVREDVGKGEGIEVREDTWESVGGSVLGPYTLTHFPRPPPFLSPHPFPTRQHTSPLTPYTLPCPSPHIFPYLPPHLFPQLPSPPPTPQHTSPLTPCTLPHLSPQFRLCGEVTM